MSTETLFSVEASHAIYVNRLASKQVNDLNRFWFSYLQSMQSALENYAPDARRSELNALIKQIEEVIEANMSDVGEQLFLDLDGFAEYETQFQAKAIGAAAGKSLALPAVEQVIAAAIASPVDMGKAGAVNLKPWLNNITRKQKEYISGQLKLGYANGVTTQDIVSSIVGTKSKGYFDGALELSRRDVAILTRTALNHYSATAQTLIYEKNKNVVIGYRIVATLDKRTSNECRGRDGQEIIFSETNERPKPPFHPNCRTITTPIIKDRPRSDTGQRASKGAELANGKLKTDPKPVNSSIDYYQFLAKQPAEFQDAVLGKTIGKAFRNSGVTPEEFQRMALKRINEPMTIENVKKYDKKLFDYIESLQKK